ncbi:YbaN family protein [Deinococcus malanensis]|uniref:YbaN family protein n=1 Tax=Deinococcus malanensis TaxID=1706855 RepID=UPI001E589453|nr:YbaN family protein [Deinococcus malanensis]
MTPSVSTPNLPDPGHVPRVRPLWVALGLVLSSLGVVGLLVPGFPGTVWFVLAAAAFARGDPRWEAWLLSRPVVGRLIGDYRAGRGMPLRAKWIACSSIALAVGFSMGRLPGLAAQLVWVLVGLAGVGFITLRVPTGR